MPASAALQRQVDQASQQHGGQGDEQHNDHQRVSGMQVSLAVEQDERQDEVPGNTARGPDQRGFELAFAQVQQRQQGQQRDHDPPGAKELIQGARHEGIPPHFEPLQLRQRGRRVRPVTRGRCSQHKV